MWCGVVLPAMWRLCAVCWNNVGVFCVLTLFPITSLAKNELCICFSELAHHLPTCNIRISQPARSGQRKRDLARVSGMLQNVPNCVCSNMSHWKLCVCVCARHACRQYRFSRGPPSFLVVRIRFGSHRVPQYVFMYMCIAHC